MQLNDAANGNAWFVTNLQFVASANEEMQALDSLDSKNTGSAQKGSTSAFQKYIICKKSNFSIFKSIFEKAREKYEKLTKSRKIVKITNYRSQYTNRVKYHIYF